MPTRLRSERRCPHASQRGCGRSAVPTLLDPLGPCLSDASTAWPLLTSACPLSPALRAQALRDPGAHRGGTRRPEVDVVGCGDLHRPPVAEVPSLAGKRRSRPGLGRGRWLAGRCPGRSAWSPLCRPRQVRRAPLSREVSEVAPCSPEGRFRDPQGWEIPSWEKPFASSAQLLSQVPFIRTSKTDPEAGFSVRRHR